MVWCSICCIACNYPIALGKLDEKLIGNILNLNSETQFLTEEVFVLRTCTKADGDCQESKKFKVIYCHKRYIVNTFDLQHGRWVHDDSPCPDKKDLKPTPINLFQNFGGTNNVSSSRYLKLFHTYLRI